jgi:hypothetical protein
MCSPLAVADHRKPPDSLLADAHHVTVLDNFDPFYDRSIKHANIAARTPGVTAVRGNAEILRFTSLRD